MGEGGDHNFQPECSATTPAVTGDRDAYKYLVESIRKFPKPPAFAKMIEAAGFRRVSFTSMTAGVVALHSGWKL